MIRYATDGDAPQLVRIYAPYVTGTAISFEETPPDEAQMRQRIAQSLAWLVLERDASIVGYAYAGCFHPRDAYRWSVEVSIYVDEGCRGSGVGGSLLDELLRELERSGHVNAFAGVALPNLPSTRLFESRGFRQVATYESVGFKLGHWHDVGWWQRQLRSAAVPPPEPRASLGGP